MKKILGLDLGTTSIGWAFVNEAENKNEESAIVRLGVRVIPLTTDEELDFEKGKPVSTNAERTLKRGMRRNLDRFQLRRKELITILKENHFIDDNTPLTETDKNSTYSMLRIRALSVKQQVEKEDIARILLMINKKRGYKSNRKAKSSEEGKAVDGMEIARHLYENDLTPGQYVYERLVNNKKYIPDFYRSDLESELNKIWEFQKQFHPDILTPEFRKQIENKGMKQISSIFLGKYGIYTAENKGKRDKVKLQSYQWRVEALTRELTKEELAYVIVEVNSKIYGSSGYLGAISDRSKTLFFNNQTVGQYLYEQIKANPHTRLKNQVFYRQDYLDEFEKIWETQKKFYHNLLTDHLKKEIRDVIIFYQRRLKSQKHLISNCEFEKYHKVIPKSSPLFQEFKIWQVLNNVVIKHIDTREEFLLDLDAKKALFEELNIREKLSSTEVLKLIVKHPKEYELNYPDLEGNRTNSALYQAYEKILNFEGEELNLSKMRAGEINETISSKFLDLGIDTQILLFNPELKGNEFDKQPVMQLWHLLYSAEDDNKLAERIAEKFGFKKEYAKLIADIPLQADYGNLSSKAVRKILPFLKEGNTYDVACMLAGYNHSSSLTKEELAARPLKDELALLPKNTLRNPVVEKILNQMVNVINAIIKDKELGKPDEIRIELARELKKSASERQKMTESIRKSTAENIAIRKILRDEFHIIKVTRNDIIKYKLWKELETNGFKTLYTNTYIRKEELFSNKFDIEHIIPKAKLFDDSFSNKTLSARKVNIEKGNDTAYDFLKKYLSQDEFEHYKSRIKNLYRNKKISKSKYEKLLMPSSKIPEDFIERDLRNSQYIAKKAKQMLEEVVRTVNTTTGSITSRLRSDWQLVNVLKEINLPKYEKLGLVETIPGKNGQPEKRITDWTKRNDHRHHAMDALTVAFTTYSHVQYLNNLAARSDQNNKKHHEIYGIEKKYLNRDKNGKLLFKPPMPVNEFRKEAKKHLESILVSFKAKNKVVTRNKNKIKTGKGNYIEKVQLTPRGQLHNETIYGKIRKYKTKLEKVGITFTSEKIEKVANPVYREALLNRLKQYDGNPKKAFGGTNTIAKNPVFIDEPKDFKVPEKVKLVWFEDVYTIRKEITPDLKIDKIIDAGIKRILNNRLAEYDDDAKKAFSNLEENPIWLNKEKGISIKRVTITGVTHAIPLHSRKDHLGNFITDENGEKLPVDYVNTGNNHHVAIYEDEQGKWHEKVVSFFEAVERKRQGLPVIDKNFNANLGWKFMFSLKQNEYFVFPSPDFDPEEIDLLNPENASLISPHLYRVQKFGSLLSGFWFRHHLETNVDINNNLKGFTYKVIQSTSNLKNIKKVRLNHLGRIVYVGEY